MARHKEVLYHWWCRFVSFPLTLFSGLNIQTADHGVGGEETMKCWFNDKHSGQFSADSAMKPEILYDVWKAWQEGQISSFRINVTIGRYPRSIHIENLLADRTFQEVIEKNFQPEGEMATWSPNAA